MGSSSEGKQFIETLYGEKPESAAIQIWLRAKRNTTWFLTDIDQAARIADQNKKTSDVYIACGLAPRAHEKPQRNRLKAHEIVGIPGVWADIDVNGGPDAKEGAAPSQEAALELASELLEPTIVVNSGYGIQAWWLLEGGPWMFFIQPEAEQAKRIVAGFQGALRAAARRLGWGLDATQDLSRVLRVPGTLNHKDAGKPQAVQTLEHGGALYNIEEIAELGQFFQASVPVEEQAVEVEVRRVVIDDRIAVLKREEPEFDQLWRMSRTNSRRKNWSPSEYEMAIVNWLIKLGLDDQAIADAVVAWRNEIEPGDPRGRCRASRISKTISRARATVSVEEEEELEEAEQDRAVQRLQSIVAGREEPHEAKTLALLNKIIKGPEIARLKQYSRDHERARFVIELADGREVVLGEFAKIAQQPMFRKAYAVTTGHYPPAVSQKKWDTAVGAMLLTAQVLDEVEDSRVGQMIEWLDCYFDECRANNRDEACQATAPFEQDGIAYVPLADFLRYLRILGERVNSADVTAILRSLGFEREAVNYDRANGGHSSRSYFAARLPLRADEVEGETE